MSKDLIPNTVFDNAPPVPPGYGAPNEYMFGDNPTNRSSIAQPGIGTGLYRPEGPINVIPAQQGAILSCVKMIPMLTLHMEFKYIDGRLNNSIDIMPGKIYTITYVENEILKHCSGKLIEIYKVDTLSPSDKIYKLKVDCSADYTNKVVIIKSDQIRIIYEYFPYSEEDAGIDNSKHKYGTTAAETIDDVVIKNATIDANGNIVSGTITQGTIVNGNTTEGIAVGYNNAHHAICVKHPTTQGGKITDGTVIYATIRTGDVSDGTVNANGTTTNATVVGGISNSIIVNSVIAGGTTISGQIFDPTIKNAVVKNAVITGNKMITNGGVTIGNITTGGTTISGDLTGGIAVGQIDGTTYTITNPKITYNGNIVTNGGVVSGGIIQGGSKNGNIITGATVVGGTLINGTTICPNGEGIIATPNNIDDFSPIKSSDIAIADTSSPATVDDDSNAIPEELKVEYKKYGTLDEIKQTMGYRSLIGKYDPHILDGLLIGYDIAHGGKFWTNIKTTTIGTLEPVQTPIP